MSSLSSLKSSCAGLVGAFYIVKNNDESVIELSVFIDIEAIAAGPNGSKEWFLIEENDACVVPSSSEVLEQYVATSMLKNNESFCFIHMFKEIIQNLDSESFLCRFPSGFKLNI